MKEVRLTNMRYRLKYHVAAKSGWINDPNGLVWFRGYYHAFFQYYPYGTSWGPMHWGHARSKDMIHWENLPVALAPDENDDGCFSGSAIEKDGRLFLIYTSHHELGDGRTYQDQSLAYSDDGVHFTKYEGNPVIKAPMSGNTENFRDPKIWTDGSFYYCVIGGQTKDRRGQVLLYKSEDIYHWRFERVLAQAADEKTEGYMWECPDYFEINGRKILAMSPQGIEPQGEFYQNLHETGYFIGEENDGKFVYDKGSFRELDRGHDFYASQTFLAPDGRRILIAWMDMWEQEFPEKEDGWAGAFTFPRELTVEDGKVRMRPIRELATIRREKILSEHDSRIGYESDTRCMEIRIKAESDVDFAVKYGDGKLRIRSEAGKLLLEKTGFSTRTITCGLDEFDIQILCDQSSVEIFIENGPVITERLYGEGATKFALDSSKPADVDIYRLEL